MDKRLQRRQRYYNIYIEKGEDVIDDIYDQILYKLKYYYRITATDRKYIGKLKKYTEFYKDLLLCGVYEYDYIHAQFIAKLDKRLHVPDDVRMYHTVSKILHLGSNE